MEIEQVKPEKTLEHPAEAELEIVSDDNCSVATGQEVEGDDDEEEDSLAAVASEDDDDDYTDFVDECGRSRGTTTTAIDVKPVARRGTIQSDAHQNHGHFTYQRNSNIQYEMASSPKSRIVSQSHQRRGSINSINETTLLPIEQQLSFGPDGLVFNMNVPWERSLRRQMQANLEKVKSSAGSNNYNNRSRQYGLGGGKPRKMVLGHSESRDFALEVGSFQSDEVSLGTAASSTVPSRMQIIHRSFLTNQHNMLATNYYGSPNPPPNNNNSHRYQESRNQDVHYHEQQNHSPRVNDPQATPCQIGAVIKGCRSADESTVSYLTNNFGHGDEHNGNHNFNNGNAPIMHHLPNQQQSPQSSSKRYEVEETTYEAGEVSRWKNGPASSDKYSGGKDYSNRNSTGRPSQSSNRSVGSSSSRRKIVNGSRVYPSSYYANNQRRSPNTPEYYTPPSEKVNLTSEPNIFMRLLELEPSQSNATTGSTVVQTTIQSMAPDTSCFCMGYDVLEYVLPPQPAVESTFTPTTTRGTSKVFNMRPSRLAPVHESNGGAESPTAVVDLTAAADLDMKFLRKPLDDPATKPWSRNYCGIDV